MQQHIEHAETLDVLLFFTSNGDGFECPEVERI